MDTYGGSIENGHGIEEEEEEEKSSKRRTGSSNNEYYRTKSEI